MNIAKLKDQARKYELKDQFDKAIKVYRKILDELEGTAELEDELSLFNKVGDLYLKKKDANAAVEMYEQAAEHYRSSGFPNNAIALYNKVLRSAPSRTNAYLRLGELMIGRGFAAEAKKNFIEYLDRMEKEGQLDQAFAALRSIADNAEDNEEIRLMLAGHLKDAARSDEARAQLQTLYAETQAHGDERKSRATLEKMQAIDPDFNPEGTKPVGGAPKKKQQTDIVFLDLESGEQEVLPPLEEATVEEAPVEEAPVEETPVEEAPVTMDEPPAEEIGVGMAVEDAGVDLTSGDDSASDEKGGDFAPHSDDVADLKVELAGGGEAAFGDTDLITQTTFDEGAGTESGEDELLEIEGADGGSSEEDADLGMPSLVSDMTLDVRASSTGIPSIEVDDDIPILDTAPPDDDQELVLEGRGEDAFGLEGPPEIELVTPDDSDVGSGDATEIELDELVLDTGGDETLEDLLRDDGSADESEQELVLDEAPGEDESQELVLEAAPADDEFTELELEGAPGSDDLEELVLDDTSEAEPSEELVVLDSSIPTLGEFEEAVSADPGNPEKRYDLAEALVEGGETERAVAEFDRAISILEEQGENARAVKVLNAVLRLDSNSTPHHRRKVEILSRMGNKSDLVSGYLAYADALLRGGDMDGARNAYLNVLEHDDSNEEARTALDTVVPEETAPTPTGPVGGGDFVNLGELIFGDDDVEMDTRMKTDSTKQSGDEDADFQEMLGQFKKGIEANIDESDAEAHYDLGVAFKEMGLLDEAIAEFQKALRGAESRLKASEALGTCFFEKGQFPVAGTVLRRAIEADSGPDEQKIGLLYWLGRCEEEADHRADALSYYQRVFAVDIKFQDVGERVSRLA